MIYFRQINSLEALKKEISKAYSENPIQGWYKDKTICTLTLKNPEEIIRAKRHQYDETTRNEFKKQIGELLQKKLIRPSHSKHSSPAFMVINHAEKVRGVPRMVIDYRNLNKATEFDGYFIPDKESLLHLVVGKQYFSKFDCKSGFWQIKMEEKSIPLTAFSTPNGHYEWLVMPFGLKNAPHVYQRRMDNVFRPYQENMLVYVDDILIASKTEEEHLQQLSDFKALVISHGIVLSEKKSKICQKEIDFLGLTIDNAGMKLQPHVSEKVNEFPDKFTKKESHF